MFALVFEALRGAMILRISVCVPPASAAPLSTRLQIISICPTPNSSAFPLKQIHLLPISKSVWHFVLIISETHVAKGTAAALPRDLF